VIRFFNAFFEDTEGFIEIRPIKPDEGVGQILFTRDFKEAKQHCLNLRNEYNLYFGVATRKEMGSGTRDNILEVTALWADLDLKDFESKDELVKKVKEFPLPCSIAVATGGGYHCYWLLKEPETVSEPRTIEGYTKGISIALNGDSVWDLPHVMRVPYTFNYPDKRKRELGRKKTYVKLQKFEPERRYNLLDFEMFYTEPLMAYPVEIEVIETELPEKFENLLESNEKLKATWEGKREDLKDQSRSGYDMSMACKLAKMGFSADEIAAVLLQMPAGKNKEATIPYLKTTISKALTISQ